MRCTNTTGHWRSTFWLLVAVLAGCGDSAEEAAPAPPAEAEAPRQHVGERLALQLVADIQAGEYREQIYEFPADTDLAPADRERVFRKLEAYVQSQEWRPFYTAIGVVRGVDDDAWVYLRGSTGGGLVLQAANHYMDGTWRIDAYESPQRSFRRRDDESFEHYFLRQIREHRVSAKPYEPGVAEDGDYFIDHRPPGKETGDRRS